jgi:hypothetical protein
MKLELAAQNDNPAGGALSFRPQIEAEFLFLPELFLNTYGKEILGWASKLAEAGPLLTINLWNPPGATQLSPEWQGQTTLCCDVAVSQKHVLMLIQPAEGEQDKIRKHCEELPKIMAAHRARASANRNTPRGAVAAVFDRIPEYFVLRYGYELREWGRNLKKIGLVKTIVLREGNLSDISPEPEQGAVLLGVKLAARIERLGGDVLQLVISPMTEQDERIIRKHCEKMQKVGIKPQAQLVEPPRPGMPFMPTVSNAIVHGEE